ncbi:hypothetical protein B0J11DRAFT_582623 [Dendryphion nanum]|uniref:Uncharacterized protein n=1 Tax=Dendryphion nanum TaxID=256645 RepID=A0A9P9DGN3_9PLEO|nr:hypothetical protein B0J11DRAFT_582623 [Dendryphion nanum]
MPRILLRSFIVDLASWKLVFVAFFIFSPTEFPSAMSYRARASVAPFFNAPLLLQVKRIQWLANQAWHMVKAGSESEVKSCITIALTFENVPRKDRSLRSKALYKFFG